MPHEGTSQPEGAGHKVPEIFLSILIVLDLPPVLRRVLIIFPHPGRNRDLGDMETDPGKEIHQVTGNMLNAVNMADDDETGNLVGDQPVPEPGVLVLDTVHALDKFLDERRVVVPAYGCREDQDIAGEHGIIHALHLIVRILEGTLAGIRAVIRVLGIVNE